MRLIGFPTSSSAPDWTSRSMANAVALSGSRPADCGSLDVRCAEVRRTSSPLSGALRAMQRSAAVRRTGDAVDRPDLPAERDDVRSVPDDLDRARQIEPTRDGRHGAVRVHP